MNPNIIMVLFVQASDVLDQYVLINKKTMIDGVLIFW